MKRVLVESEVNVFEEQRVDTFQEAAMGAILGLYGFMGLCIIAAMLATLHTFYRVADNVCFLGFVCMIH